jgi:hypothetical protein
MILGQICEFIAILALRELNWSGCLRTSSIKCRVCLTRLYLLHCQNVRDSLKEGQIPIFPVEHCFSISTRGKPHTKVYHRQYPLTSAYAFTDHKAQGQTMEPVLVDIGQVLGNFGISPFGAYVALSRGHGHENIRLLRDFEDNLFMRHPSEKLRLEDLQLEELSRKTKERWEVGFYDFGNV